MKILFFFTFSIISNLFYAQSKLIQDIDLDQKQDTIFLDFENKIVCKLSSNNHRALYSEPLETGGDDKIISSENGFALVSSWMRASQRSNFVFNRQTNEILLQFLSAEYYGNALNDYSGIAMMDLFNSTFTGNFNHFDENAQTLITLPKVFKKRAFVKITLEQYTDFIIEDFQNISSEYYGEAIFKYSMNKSPEEIENIVLKNFSDLHSMTKETTDSIEKYSDIATKNIIDLINNNPETLNFDFQKLAKKIKIITSKDNKLRLYSWDTENGGTMHFFRNIYQYQTENEVKSFAQPLINLYDTQSYCSAIYSTIINKKKYYLVITNGVYSSSDLRQSVLAFHINEDGMLEPAMIFNTNDKLSHKIDVDYDFFSVKNQSQRPFQLITFDEKKNILYIPLVEELKVTSKKLKYKLKRNLLNYKGTR